MYYRNQRLITIMRETPNRNSGRKYLCAYEDNLFRAMKTLSRTAFDCYIYLLCNKDGYEKEWSPAHVSQVTGVSIESVRRSFSELENKGYLKESEYNKHFYTFYEVPQIQDKSDTKEILNPYTGEYITLTYIQTLAMFGVEKGNELWG